MRNSTSYINRSYLKSISIILLLPFLVLVNSFSQPHNQLQHQRHDTIISNNIQNIVKPSSRLFTSTEVDNTSSNKEKINEVIKNRNIFQSNTYKKPIVLVGASNKKNNELYRLANYFTKDQLHQQQSTDDSVISPLKSYNNPKELLNDINNNIIKFPQVIVLDYNEEEKDDEKLMIEYAKELYETSKLLSIFINVESSKKETLEENVFVKYTDYEICIKDEGDDEGEDWSHMEWELTRLIARAMLSPAIPGDKTINTYNNAHLTMGKHTFFLSLSFPKIEDVQPYVKEMCVDVDAMEYRCDLLDKKDSRFEMIYGQQLLRKYCRPHAVRVPGLPFGDNVIDDSIPIVYTVRTKNQAGTYPDEDDEDISKMFDMLSWGLRAGVDVLDVESAWDYDKYIDKLLSKAEERYTSQILGSHHVLGKEIGIEDAVSLYQQCALFGRSHGAKVVLSIEDDKKDSMAYEASLIASSLAASDDQPIIPNISLILGKFRFTLYFPTFSL